MDNTVYVITKLDLNGPSVETAVFVDAYDAYNDVMTQVYGEDWEEKMAQDDEIQTYFDALTNDYGFEDDDGIVWNVEKKRLR